MTHEARGDRRVGGRPIGFALRKTPAALLHVLATPLVSAELIWSVKYSF